MTGVVGKIVCALRVQGRTAQVWAGAVQGRFSRWHWFCTETLLRLYYLVVQRGRTSLQLIIFSCLSDLCRLQINIQHDPHSTKNDVHQTYLQRILRNIMFQERLTDLWKFIHPCIRRTELVLSSGPLHLPFHLPI